MDTLRPAPVQAPAVTRIANPDYLPKGTIETANLNAPDMVGLASDSSVRNAQRRIIERSGLQPGDCGTLAVLIKPKGFNALMIGQIFTVAADPSGLRAGRIGASSSKVPENSEVTSWLNAGDYAYRVATRDVVTGSGVPVQVAFGKLKTCP